jgi:deoxyribonuclease V
VVRAVRAVRAVPVARGAVADMGVARPEFEPDPALSTDEMEALQRDIADVATFEDDLPFDPTAVGVAEPLDLDGSDVAATRQANLDGDAPADPAPVVAGVDQAFLEERAVSAVVAVRGGAVVEVAHAVTDVEIPYVPGLLAFREGRPILAALAELSVAPDLLVVDGSGRIHFRQAGIATHVGVLLDVPAVGVAKSLLCGTPAREFEEGLPAGERVEILAGDSMDAPGGTVVGHAYQSRQYDSPDRHVNPLYVSPGHRVSAETATELVAAVSAGYKLPEPTRLADRAADEAKATARE